MDIQEINKAIDLYKSGLSLSQVGRELNCDKKTIAKYFKRNNIEILDRKPNNKITVEKFTFNSIQERDIKIIELYKSGLGASLVARSLGICKQSVFKILKANNIEIDKNRKPGKNLDSIIDKIIEEYKSGKSAVDIGKLFNISGDIIISRLKKHNIPINETHSFIKIDTDKINKMYLSGMSTYSIAEKFNCSNETIARRLTVKLRDIKERNNLRPEGYKDKMSVISKENWQKQEYINKVKAGKTEEYYRVLSEKSKESWRDPIFRDKMKKVMNNENYKKNLSDFNKNRWDDPKYREKMLPINAINIQKAREIGLDILKNNLERREKWLSKLRKHGSEIRASLAKGYTSFSQEQLYYILKQSDINYVREGIGTKVDFYTMDCIIPKQMEMKRDLIIEVNGEFPHSFPKIVARDQGKATYVRDNTDYDLLVIDDLMVSNWDVVRNKLESFGLRVKSIEININDLAIKQITELETKLFYSIFHYTNTIRKGAKTYGAYYNDQLVAAISYTCPIRLEVSSSLNCKSNEIIEISRLARCTNLVCENLMSWFISKTIKKLNKNIKIIVSYSDTTYGHTGGVYKASNFVKDREILNNYSYITPDGCYYHKKTIWDRAKKFKKSEEEYALLHGLTKILTGKKYRWIFKRG